MLYKTNKSVTVTKTEKEMNANEIANDLDHVYELSNIFLEHSVEPNMSDFERISLAMNFSYNKE